MPPKIPFPDVWAGKADCRSCALRDSVLFAGLEEADFEQIHQPIDQRIYQPGDTLYRAGDTDGLAYTIRRGLVKLVQYLPDGSQRIVRLLKSTDITGMEALLGDAYTHDAVVMQETEVCCLPTATVNRLSAQNPALHQELMKRWQRALREADAWLTELSTGSARQRVARLLLRLGRDRTDHRCELFSREEMGAMLGITTETTSRTIAEFKRQNWLRDLGRNLHEIDINALQELTGDTPVPDTAQQSNDH